MKPLLRLCIVIAVGLATAVAAAPRKVLVLPIDGDADPGTRTQLNATIQRLARGIEGTVSVADTTFADTASAMGCDPNANACADTVLTALAVDELVWGTAKTSRGQVTLVVKRATKGNVQQQSVAVDPKSPEAVGGTLAPLFGSAAQPAGSGSASNAGSGSAVEGSASGSAEAGSATTVEPPQPWSRDKKLGITLAAAGGVALIVGFALWANESSIQGQIDSTATPVTLQDVMNLKTIEDRAASYALWGNILVISGAVIAGAGGYYLWRDHSNHVTAIAPVPAEHGAGATLVVGGHW
jgi:hypothetical protein